MPVRVRASITVVLFLAATFMTGLSPRPAAAATGKVAVVVGPVGSLTNTYRSMADEVAADAVAAGATVVKAYSPNATWANVRAAVAGANVIVYFGHGNGYPNPYSSTENTDRVNGWGLNRTTTNGDADSWSSTMVYCGEKALLGTLTSGDGAAQWSYCGGSTNTDGIAPAPGFVMVYAQAHYAPGFGERYVESDPVPTLSQAQQRVRNYSYPALVSGASAYFATAYGDADRIVSTVLANPTRTYGEVFRAGSGYSATALRTMAHPDVAGAQVWVQQTVAGSMHFGDPDYWYAYAGDPNRTFSGSTVPGPTILKLYPGAGSTNASPDSAVTATFDQSVTGVSTSSFTLRSASGSAVPAAVGYNAYWKRAELRPSAPLVGGATYTASLTAAIRTAAGGPLTPRSWTFTVTAPPPSSGGDNVDYDPAVRLTFRQGTHTGYRFSAGGAPSATRTVTLATDSGASTSMRRVLTSQSGRWFYVVNGAWSGYWLRESSAISLAASAAAAGGATTDYDPAVRLVFGRGTHTGYRFGTNGAPVAERTVTLAADSGASASTRRSIVNQYGSWFSIVDGAWSGYWLRESDVIHLP